MSKFLEVYWARTHNLKNLDLKIPKNKITVITGVSWSWKSSLAFNTIYSVWQQKYLESLSSYARMFIWWIKEEAEVDEIKWLSPTISIDQKTTSKNPRSTVWTITEIFDYYKLLFLNIWIRKCIKCQNIVAKNTIDDVVNYLGNFEIWTKFLLKSTIKWEFNNFDDIKKEVLWLWFIRFCVNNEIYTINDDIKFDPLDSIDIVIDRLVVKDFTDNDSSDTKRLKDSIELSFKVWSWQMVVETINSEIIENKNFSNIFVCSNCWHIPEELNISSFSFNSHSWACPECHWLWVKKIFLEENIINYDLTLLEGAIVAPWFWGEYFFELLKVVWKENWLELNKNYSLLPKKQRDIILYWTWTKTYKIEYVNEYGVKNTYNSRFEWVINTLTRRYFDWWADKGNYDEFVVDMDCPLCNGQRLKQETLSVYLHDKNIWDLADLSADKAIDFLKTLKLTKNQEKIVKKVLKNSIDRLSFLVWVWLNYMTISRKAWTLSGWEAQRIRLATQIWTQLEGIIYILDEPSIWLHPRDNDMLIENIKKLRDIWNTLIIVEHDEDIMKNSDYIIDIWPWAWIHGWTIVAEWTLDEIISNKNSVTWPYLNWKNKILIKRWERKIDKYLEIIWAKEHNLKNINVFFPLWNFITVTWVSWSGKSSLINDILANYLANKLNRAKRQVWSFEEIRWIQYLDKTVIIDQSPIWRTPRSNPATYTTVFTPIRDVFAQTQEAQIRWYWPWRFSFNTKHWRCEECEWDWVKKIEMHFLPTVYVECEKCRWQRYNNETLKIKYKWKTISDVLNMTVEEWIDFFANHPKIITILKILNEVGLWYIKLWQSATTLSGWEAQRIKLSTELSKKSTTKTFYILDEPTTWLHFQDVNKLLVILHSLVDKWNTVLVIEHNMDVIVNSDYIIDIWLEWWDKWWELIFAWTLEEMKKCKKSYTKDAIEKYYR